MAFAIGLFIGSAATFMVVCITASKKIRDSYFEGYIDGRDDALHRVDRGIRDE